LKLRQEKVAQRKLAITSYAKASSLFPRPWFVILAISILLGISSYLFFTQQINKQSHTETSKKDLSEDPCWTGYSLMLGEFKQVDEADPCHYRKLLHNAVSLLKEQNNTDLKTSALGLSEELGANQDYILFLSSKLDQRRVMDKIILNIELGKSALNKKNYFKAKVHFKAASEMLSPSNAAHRAVHNKISHFNELIESKPKL